MEVYVPGAVARGLGGGMKKAVATPEEKELKAKQRALFALFSKSQTPTLTNKQDLPNPKSDLPIKMDKTSKKRKLVDNVSEEDVSTPTKKVKKEVPTPTKKVKKEVPTPTKKVKKEVPTPTKKVKKGDGSTPTKKAKKEDVPTPTKKAKRQAPETTKSEITESPTQESETLNETISHIDRGQQRKNRKKKDPEKNARTIFVGNVPNTVQKRMLLGVFKKYGIIESLRYRSAAPADLKLPKKAVINTKSFHKDLKTLNVYVVFKKKEAAKDALARNGTVLEGSHIRVDLAKNAKLLDTKASVFIGNLPFNVEDEQVRAHFQDCGQIEGIRIIRENRTGLGKGFGYIKFADKDGMNMALRLNGHLFLNRTIRVQKAEESTKSKENKATEASGLDRGQLVKKKDVAHKKEGKKVGRNMPSNITPKDFQGLKAKSLQTIKKRQQNKKKFKKQKSTDDLVKGNKGVLSKKSTGSHIKQSKGRPNKGAAARSRIGKKVKKDKPRKTKFGTYTRKIQ